MDILNEFDHLVIIFYQDLRDFMEIVKKLSQYVFASQDNEIKVVFRDFLLEVATYFIKVAELVHESTSL